MGPALAPDSGVHDGEMLAFPILEQLEIKCLKQKILNLPLQICFPNKKRLMNWRIFHIYPIVDT